MLRIRDEAREIAPSLGASGDGAKLDELIVSLLGTSDSRLATEPGRARGLRQPFDTERVTLFEALHGALSGHVPVRRGEVEDRRAFAFYVVYFSNFIEGTEFEVEEAEAIVFDRVIPKDRPEDAHDVLGTFDAIVAPTSTPRDADDFAEL